MEGNNNISNSREEPQEETVTSEGVPLLEDKPICSDHEEEELEDLECFSKPIKTADDAVEYWEHHLSKGTLACHQFREWWRQKVPRLLGANPSMDYQSPQAHIDDDVVKAMLMVPLEKFMCANTCPDQVLQTLSELNDPPAVCGKKLKMGETTYSCRDCGHDPTCVLCVECFKSSNHRSHRYKMSITNGGGYCDCGDAEAWSKDVHCSTHALGAASNPVNKDPISKLPLDIQTRTRLVFQAVLNYTFEILTTDSFLMLPADLTHKREYDELDGALDTDSSSGMMDAMSSSVEFVAIIYNDEIHTFDEVIQTLPRAVDCDRNAAMGFANMIDREGRCVVKCSGFQACSEVKKTYDRSYVRRGGKPLKVVIMHGHLLAHQIFAQRLLTWLQGILDASMGFKALLSSLLLECPTTPMLNAKTSRLDRWLRKDTVLWKSARSSVHHLLVSSMLLSDDNMRRAFAATYTKAYGHLMKEFISDNHDHSFSVTSLSVQFFTVPTLAHHLIAHDDVLAILLTTFMSECERKKNDRGKLEFQRNLNLQSFRRTCYILWDIKHLLSTSPDQINNGWSNELRKGFLHGVSLLFDILSWMQGMDLQVKQNSHHVEYELEWEAAFRLHMNLAMFTTHILQWCGTDKVVFIKAMRMMFKRLFDEHQSELGSVGSTMIAQSVAGRTATCLDYQVSMKPVSMHQPLTRLLAGLCLHMSKFDLDLNANEFDIMEKPSPPEMMEPSLRTTVLVAQIQSGLWRRNGYSLVDQARVYRDLSFRREMLDQDIVMLQVAAANMDSDDYMINLLNKFQLISWVHRDFDCAEDDSVRQITTLVEEFLSTLIHIISERFVPGVGQVTYEDAVRHEIIQLLCVEPMSHSSLSKALAEAANTTMEKVVESVATFKKPKITKNSASNKGKYVLKTEFHNQYNTFFYHYSKEEQSKSEEAQRLYCKTAGQPECNPPPCPPELTKQFYNLTNILQSDVFLYLVSLILERADNLRSRCFSENQVHRVLHLIGIALHEEDRFKVKGEKGEFNFTGKASEKYNLYGLLEKLVGSQRIESHTELVNWTIKKWQQVAGITTSASSTSLMPHCDSAMSLVSSVSLHESLSGADLSGDKEAEKKRLAAERRKKIMEQMKSAQKNFMKENATLFDDTASGLSRPSSNVEMLTEDTSEMEEPLPCIGPNRAAPTTTDASHTCILCQEDEMLEAEGKAMVMAALVQKSTVLSNRHPDQDASDLMSTPFCMSLLPADLHCAPHASSCGHVMHASCWQRYYNDVQASENQRSRMKHPLSFDVQKQEFLCPLCRSLSNCVVPLIPQFHLMQPLISGSFGQADDRPETQDSLSVLRNQGTIGDDTGPVEIPFMEWIEGIITAVQYKKELLADPDPPKTSEKETTPTEPNNLQNLLHTVQTVAEEGASRLVRALSGPSSEESTTESEAAVVALPKMKRYYTCPLDQILQELDEKFGTLSGRAFSRLFTDKEGHELVFSASVFEMMNLYCKAVYRVGLNVVPELHDERIPLQVWGTCAFTIHAAVVSGLDAGKASVVDSSAMSSRQRDCLTALVRLCGVVGSNFGEPKIIRSHGLMLLSILSEVDGIDNPSILDLDVFGLLVGLTFSLPSLFHGDHSAPLPAGNVQDSHLLHLAYVVHLVQIILTTDQFSTNMDDDDDNDKTIDKDMQPILELLHAVREAVGFTSDNDGSEGLNAKAVWSDMVRASLPFLRCAALFYHNLTNVPGPSNLVHLADNEFPILAKYLSLPTTPKELMLGHPRLLEVARLWASHPSVYANLAVASPGNHNLTYPLRLNSLVPLPHDYSELINTVSSFTCPNSLNDESRVPTMCLICGVVLCSQSVCCQTVTENGPSVGACTAHAEVCGAGNGIFLRVRECKIVLLSDKTKGCFIEPPYLDQYGETDIGLRRGNPLRLCPERYRKIYKMWLNHNIPETVSHVLESNQFFLNTPWFHL